jgi:hypothetical protein
MADVDAEFVQKILHIAKRKRETNVHHRGQAYDLRARLEVTKGGTFCHPKMLGGRPARIKKISSDSAQAMVQVLLNMLDLGMSAEEAVQAPRVATYSFPGSFAPHVVHPNKVLYEEDLPEAQIQNLAERGHDVEAWPAQTWLAGGICLAMRDETGVTAVADPRRAGSSAIGSTPAKS